MAEQVIPGEIFADIKRDIEDLVATLDGETLEYKVEVGSVLWMVGELASKAIDRIKADLRTEALKETPGEGSLHSFEGNGTVATVKFPHTSLKLAKNVHIEALKKQLGEDFALYFDEKISHSVRKDFEANYAVASKEHQEILVNSIERVENTPRVSFRRSK